VCIFFLSLSKTLFFFFQTRSRKKSGKTATDPLLACVLSRRSDLLSWPVFFFVRTLGVVNLADGSLFFFSHSLFFPSFFAVGLFVAGSASVSSCTRASPSVKYSSLQKVGTDPLFPPYLSCCGSRTGGKTSYPIFLGFCALSRLGKAVARPEGVCLALSLSLISHFPSVGGFGTEPFFFYVVL